MRLRELFERDADGRPRLTWRELGVYVRRLPPESATRTALNEGKPEPSAETILLADCFDMLQHVAWYIQASNATKKSELPKKPRPYPRWWAPDRRRRQHSPQRQARIKDAQRRAAERRRLITEGAIT